MVRAVEAPLRVQPPPTGVGAHPGQPSVQKLFTCAHYPRAGLRSRAASDIRCLPWGSHCECVHSSHFSARHPDCAWRKRVRRNKRVIRFDCVTTKVIITDKAGHIGSVQAEERLSFWIDDAAKTLHFF